MRSPENTISVVQLCIIGRFLSRQLDAIALGCNQQAVSPPVSTSIDTSQGIQDQLSLASAQGNGPEPFLLILQGSRHDPLENFWGSANLNKGNRVQDQTTPFFFLRFGQHPVLTCT